MIGGKGMLRAPDVEENIKPVYHKLIIHREQNSIPFKSSVSSFCRAETEVGDKNTSRTRNKLLKAYARIPPHLPYIKVLSTRELRA